MMVSTSTMLSVITSPKDFAVPFRNFNEGWSGTFISYLSIRNVQLTEHLFLLNQPYKYLQKEENHNNQKTRKHCS